MNFGPFGAFAILWTWKGLCLTFRVMFFTIMSFD